MVPWNKLPKDLQKAVLAIAVLYGGTAASCCGPLGPMVCDPMPPPSSTPVGPMVCDPMPPPSSTPVPGTTPTITPSPTPMRRFSPRLISVSQDASLAGASIRGKVLDPAGNPLYEVYVGAREEVTEHGTWTDYRGEFSLEVERPGAYRFACGRDWENALPLELKRHEVATVECTQAASESSLVLPLAERRSVEICQRGPLTFSAESPWLGAQYHWTASGGSLRVTGGRARWVPPEKAGRYLLQVAADWGADGLAVDAAILVVAPDGATTVS